MTVVIRIVDSRELTRGKGDVHFIVVSAILPLTTALITGYRTFYSWLNSHVNHYVPITSVDSNFRIDHGIYLC